MQRSTAFFGFNRGLVSRLALSRVDMKRLAMSAETMENFMPRVLGSMMLRPGLGYIGATASNNQARFLPFVFSTSDTALIELTDLKLRVWVGDELISRVAVTSAVTNGNFDTDLTGWTDSDESGGTSAWVTGGYMGLTGDGSAAAIRDQQVSVAGAKGYFAGGYTGVASNVIDGIQFSDDSAFTIAATLSSARYAPAGVATAAKGYFGGGYTSSLSNEIDGIQFSNESAINPAASLSVARQSAATVVSATKGYFGGGYSGSATNLIDGILFSNESAFVSTVTLVAARWLLAGVSSSTRGYFGGGHSSGVDSAEIDGLQFSDETIAVNPSATLSLPRYSPAGVSSSAKGYFGGGGIYALSTATNVIDGIRFSDELAVTAGATLAVARERLAGVASAAKGYWGGGITTGSVHSAEIDSMRFSDEVAINPSAALSVAREQLTGVSSPESQSSEHGLQVVVQRGPVTFRVGSSQGADDYVAETQLETGTHSLAFTPTGNFHVRFSSTLKRQVLISSCNLEAAGVMELATPWGVASLRSVREFQSGDVLFVACKNFLQRKIERRGARSWSLVWYLSDNGPYKAENKTETTIAASATSGNITLTASRGIFTASHVQCLFKVRSEGQTVTAAIAAQNTFTSTIQVTGVGEARRFAITITGTWSATATLQRSVGVVGNWVDVSTYTANVATTFADDLDNQIVFYRIGIKTGAYTSGTATTTLDYPLGSITGVARVTGYTNSTTVSAEVLEEFGGTTASKYWSEGSWSTASGFPTAVAIYEGRLWWAGNNGVFGSVSDDFYNFDPATVGDSAPISRTVGSGPVDDINWILPLQRLILGAEGAEHSVRATSFDEVLTPSNFNIKEASSLGSNNTLAQKIDSRGVYVQRGGTRLFELAFDAEVGDYRSTELTLVIPDIGEPSIVHVAIQRLPDTRIHCVRSDGKVAVLVYNHVENVLCWVLVSAGGTNAQVEDVVVLPGDVEDVVYYVVKRTIDGSTVRYLEQWALESEGRGAAATKCMDSHVTYTGASSTTITGLGHLEGETVVIWGNSKDLGTKTVVNGQITTLPEAVTTAYVGLPYTAQWKSTKLAYSVPGEPLALNEQKRVGQVGFVLADAYAGAIRFGPDFSNLDDMPATEDGAEVAAGTIHTAYDEELIPFPGTWDSDARVCLQAASPRPVTVLAIVITYVTEKKS